MRYVALGVLALAVSACATAPPTATVAPSDALAVPLSQGVVVTVMPFSAPQSVVSYEGDTGTLGHDFAREVVAGLRSRGYTARLGDPLVLGSVNVVGRILRVDGGSHAKRFWLGYGAGRSSLSVEGTVAGADGSQLGAFRERRSSSGMPELGFSGDEYLIDKCLRVLASDVAEMVATGRYRVAILAE